MYFNTYSIPVIASALLMFVLGFLIRTQKTAPGGRWFSILMIAGAVYSVFYALEISATDLSLVKIFYRLEYLGIPFIPAFFALFAISFTRGESRLNPGLVLLVLAIPVLNSVLALTSGMHNFFITEGYIEHHGVFPVFIFSPGPGYWLHTGYTLVAITYSVLLLVKMLLVTAAPFRKQVVIVLAGTIVPYMIYINYLFGIFPEGLDPNPFSFAFTGLLIFFGIFKFRLFILSPLARNMLFENIPDGVLVIDRDFILVDLNKAASVLFDINQVEIGKPVGEVLKDWPDIISFVTENEPGRKFEISRITEDMTLFMDCHFISLTDERGLEKGKMLLMHDTSLQRRAEIERFETEERFRVVFENAPFGLMYYDNNGIIELCNEYFISLLGSAEDRLIGLSLLHLEDKRLVNIVKKTLEGRKAVFEGRYTSQTGSKSVYIKAVFKPLMSKNNVVEGGLCIVEDVSSRKAAETRINKTNTELKKLNAEKDRFFSILAHDLRSPFSSFLGYTDILEESLDTMSQDMLRSIVSSLKESANNLYSLLENLLQWSRMQQGSVDYFPEELEVKDSILACIEPMISFANNKAIDVRYDLPKDIKVYADQKMFDTIIRNLFTNAVKFTSREGSILISASAEGKDHVEIRFSDTGIGMSSDMVNNIFRVDKKTSRTGTEGELSSGLGLILCKEFVDLHGGSISLKSREGKGTSFFIKLKKYPPVRGS